MDCVTLIFLAVPAVISFTEVSVQLKPLLGARGDVQDCFRGLQYSRFVRPPSRMGRCTQAQWSAFMPFSLFLFVLWGLSFFEHFPCFFHLGFLFLQSRPGPSLRCQSVASLCGGGFEDSHRFSPQDVHGVLPPMVGTPAGVEGPLVTCEVWCVSCSFLTSHHWTFAVFLLGSRMPGSAARPVVHVHGLPVVLQRVCPHAGVRRKSHGLPTTFVVLLAAAWRRLGLHCASCTSSQPRRQLVRRRRRRFVRFLFACAPSMATGSRCRGSVRSTGSSMSRMRRADHTCKSGRAMRRTRARASPPSNSSKRNKNQNQNETKTKDTTT